jgi:AbrB family looped-hinge helix DNA binding protein
MGTVLKLGQNGRMIIPAELRHSLDLKEGDELLVTVEGKRLVLETEAALLERLYATVGEPPKGKLVSDELIRERREEAEREVADQ